MSSYLATSEFSLQSFAKDDLSCSKTVRVKGGMSLRNGMWHDLRNGIIYAEYYTLGMKS